MEVNFRLLFLRELSELKTERELQRLEGKMKTYYLIVKGMITTLYISHLFYQFSNLSIPTVKIKIVIATYDTMVRVSLILYCVLLVLAPRIKSLIIS